MLLNTAKKKSITFSKLRYHFFVIFFLYIIFSSLIINLFSFFEIIKIIDIQFFNFSKVFIAIMTGNKRVNKIEFDYNTWISVFLEQNYASWVRYYGIGSIETSNKEVEKLYVSTEVNISDVSRNHLCSKIKFAIEDFLFKTDASWFIRICDDTFVNMKTFKSFLDDLNQNYNPIKQFIVQGNCIGKEWKSYAYIQGGAGIIFSRFAAEQLLNEYDSFQNICNKIINDDTSLGIWLNSKNYSAYNATNRFFIGHHFRQVQFIDNFLTKNFILPNCPSKYAIHPNKGCRSFLTKLKSITFWHDKVKFHQFMPFAETVLANISDNIYYYQVSEKPEACFGTPDTKEMYLN